MVALDKIDCDSGFGHFPEAVQKREPVLGDYVIPLEPEIEKIPQDIQFSGIFFNMLQKGMKVYPFQLFIFTVFKTQMNI
jgi:hypothetical protein